MWSLSLLGMWVTSHVRSETNPIARILAFLHLPQREAVGNMGKMAPTHIAH
jgi:hypothetical protein